MSDVGLQAVGRFGNCTEYAFYLLHLRCVVGSPARLVPGFLV